jgi:hypothetical protein
MSVPGATKEKRMMIAYNNRDHGEKSERNWREERYKERFLPSCEHSVLTLDGDDWNLARQQMVEPAALGLLDLGGTVENRRVTELAGCASGN